MPMRRRSKWNVHSYASSKWRFFIRRYAPEYDDVWNKIKGLRCFIYDTTGILSHMHIRVHHKLYIWNSIRFPEGELILTIRSKIRSTVVELLMYLWNVQLFSYQTDYAGRFSISMGVDPKYQIKDPSNDGRVIHLSVKCSTAQLLE